MQKFFLASVFRVLYRNGIGCDDARENHQIKFSLEIAESYMYLLPLS